MFSWGALNLGIKHTFQASLVSTLSYINSKDMKDFSIEINLTSVEPYLQMGGIAFLEMLT